MNTERKISISQVLLEGTKVGFKNLPSLIGAFILWILTIWIPYVNVGTTIAISTLPIALSKGKVVSPTFIFDAKYRQYMGEYFTLLGMMFMALIPAFFFLIIPGYTILISWSLALYIMIDKGIAPGEALVKSNKATYGYKWTIFGIFLVIGLFSYALFAIVRQLFFVDYELENYFSSSSIMLILLFLLLIFIQIISIGCQAIIYRKLTEEKKLENNEFEKEINEIELEAQAEVKE
ncbi:MAG: hypothetical protein RR319_06980 [Bacteroides sp.]